MAAGYVDTNGVRLWYEVLGRSDRAPVLLLAGGGASVVWWPPELIEGLVGAGYRVVQFDNRDTGLSSYIDWASAPYGIQDMAGDAMGCWTRPWGIPIVCAPCRSSALPQGPTHASRRVTRRCSLVLTARSRPMRTSPSWRSTFVAPWPGAGSSSMSRTIATSSPPISPGA